ncbi:MAG: hypothetical protein ACFE0I_19845 [Elainellaceae cyanobacterium]
MPTTISLESSWLHPAFLVLEGSADLHLRQLEAHENTKDVDG